MSLPVIVCENLTTGYRKKNADVIVNNVINLSIEKGKFIALVGENGIGKSTLIKTITGILKPIKGNVFIENQNISSIDIHQLAKYISIVLTEKLPPSNLTVYELVAIGRQPYTNWLGKLTRQDKQKINEAIALTQIAPFLNKKFYELSDGQLQTVLIARALAQDTAIIILDEPTTHLDLPHKVSLLKLLKKLASETNKCILYSTHDIDLAIQLTDEMVVLLNDTCIKDSPCKLIENNVFSTLFKDENIIFDSNKGKFTIT